MSATDASIVTWDAAYSVGSEAIDDQHRALFATINRLWSALIAKGHPPQIAQLIEELERYTIAHFTAEEVFMEATHYPDLAEHRKLHRQFTDRIAAERAQVAQGKTISLDLLHFLKDWLVEHIQVEDQRYAAHCRQSQQKPSGIAGFFKRFWA